ncbi:MAG: hypothetical protein KIH63_001380 [Candidatus Saccharibacteria bacterium]|nr:hypothetical protein [Candidatus Saccharibacteria bacterium]
MKLNPVVRATGIIGATAALVTGVTFAALSSSATLTQNTISSETTDLVIDRAGAGDTDVDPVAFDETDAGFAFTGILPGSVSSQTEAFSLRNLGTVNLGVKVKIANAGVLPAGVDATDVVFTFESTTGEPTITPTWADLTSVDGVTLVADMDNNPVASEEFTVKVSLDNSVTGESVSITAFDFVFTGTAIAPAP